MRSRVRECKQNVGQRERLHDTLARRFSVRANRVAGGMASTVCTRTFTEQHVVPTAIDDRLGGPLLTMQGRATGRVLLGVGALRFLPGD